MKAVREMDHDGLLLCKIQAETFELSVEKAGDEFGNIHPPIYEARGCAAAGFGSDSLSDV